MRTPDLALQMSGWRDLNPRPLRLYVMIVRPVGFARFFVAPACGLVACSGCAALPGAVPRGAWPDRSLPGAR